MCSACQPVANAHAVAAAQISELVERLRVVDGLQIRYAETGGSSSERIVLTSPWPESLHAFRRVWPTLSTTAMLLAIDLPGFGRSERPHRPLVAASHERVH